MSRKEWSKNHTFDLILMYEENQMLWDTKHPDYRNREKKNKIFNMFGTKFECSAEEIQRKIHNLRNQMSQEIKKCAKKKSGSGTNDLEYSNWPYFQSLKFLTTTFTVNITKSSYTQPLIEQSTSEIENEVVVCKNENESTSNLISSHHPTIVQSKKRKQNKNDEESELFKSALKSLNKESDNDEKFGQYVALEIKSLKSEFNKARLKSEIRKIIVKIADEDMYASFPPFSSCPNSQ